MSFDENEASNINRLCIGTLPTTRAYGLH